MKNLCNLQPIYSHQKSYYGKAKILKLDEQTYGLYSYGELIAAVKNKEARICSWWCCSMTTTKHVHEFLAQYAFGFGGFTTEAFRNSIRFFEGDYDLFRRWGFNRFL